MNCLISSWCPVLEKIMAKILDDMIISTTGQNVFYFLLNRVASPVFNFKQFRIFHVITYTHIYFFLIRQNLIYT
jgi:hypothetical protein